MELLAHSGRARRGLGPQSYSEHVLAVRGEALEAMEAALRYRVMAEPALRTMAEWAATFHDLGKLDPNNQHILRTSERGKLSPNHVDAGVAQLRSVGQVEAAIAVYGHHIGLCDLPTEMAKDEQSRQDPALAALRDYRCKLGTDASLAKLLALHRRSVADEPADSPRFRRKLGGLERRLLLSCLVDADHGNTAQFYGNEPDLDPAKPRWEERLAALDRYVSELTAKGGVRAALRSELYGACRAASTEHLIQACDGPVGSGKTTAVMAYLLQAAKALELRHIFVVLPYTNIIRQSVEVYRQALVLPGEDPERVVAAHHHQAEFREPDLRYLTTLWDSPIIVTTAVQFFETLAANQTVRLRKLHQLPGSAVFVDEAHAAMPIHLWPYMWDQLKSLARDWRCRFVLGSGSLTEFWTNERIMGKGRTESVPSVISDDLRAAGSLLEKRRVRYDSRPGPLSLAVLCDWIQEATIGPRLVVLNTVQSAAVVADAIRRQGHHVMHLSTALAPDDRERVLQRVRARLKCSNFTDWTLVATSCVEAGVDFSFGTAFRERSRAASLAQIGGRVNRHGEREEGVVWDFVVNDPLLTLHPDFKHSRDVVEDLFQKRMWERDLTKLMTYALEQEFKRDSGEDKIAELWKQEAQGSYPRVAELTRLITADTRLVVVDPGLVEAIREGERVEGRQLLRHSVQLCSTKIRDLALNQIGHGSELYAWDYEYDPDFLGVMEGILRQQRIRECGFALV
jgi:CRISPR-associated endonuclease/helicase Cas3